MQIPESIKKALSKSTSEKKQPFIDAYNAFNDLYLYTFAADSPDIRFKHPHNNIVFITLCYQVRKATRFDLATLSQSLGFTPVSADTLTDVFREYIEET